MKVFFTGIFSSFIGFMLASFVMLFIVISIVIGLITSVSQEIDANQNKQAIWPRSVLSLKLNHPITDKTSDDPFDHYDFNTFEPRISLGLDEIIANIKKAKTDDRIEGIYLNLSPTPHGWATSEAIRNALIDFKQSEKWILAYNETYSQNSYYISSVADEIFLNPEGYFEFKGLNAQSMFFKNTLAKLDIEIQILRGPNNEFKSAVEPFFNDEMSDKSRFQTQVLVNEIWAHVLNNISQETKISTTELMALADNLSISRPQDAAKAKLVTGLMYQDEVRNLIREKLNLIEDEKLRSLSIGEYAMEDLDHSPFRDFTALKKNTNDQIAIIFAEGNIVSGESDRGVIGSQTLSLAIREARENEFVKAIVVRVNSPGGSALASDVILRELKITKDLKPIVVSFGNVAASGGYYIAAEAHKIFSQANTITGSIGVFGIFPNMKGFFNNKLGVTFDSVATNKHASFGSLSRGMNAFEIEKANKQTAAVYQTFKEHVASGRNLTIEQVEAIARGRIWTGKSAQEVGLVDEIGGLYEALDEAAKLANLSEHYDILKLPKEPNPFERFFGDIENQARGFVFNALLNSESKEIVAASQEIQHLKHNQGVQARMPFLLNIQ